MMNVRKGNEQTMSKQENLDLTEEELNVLKEIEEFNILVEVLEKVAEDMIRENSGLKEGEY